jgi:hypothetical protein
MAQRMPPPGTGSGGSGKPGVMVMIGIPKHGADGPSASGPSSSGKMPPPGTPPPDPNAKHSPDEAAVVRSDQHCVDCENYSVDTGECKEVEGTFSPDDACAHYFTPVADNDDEQAESEPQSGGVDEANEASAPEQVGA